MDRQKNNSELKGILIPRIAHKKLIEVKNELELKTIGRTIISLVESRKDLLEKEDDFKDQTKNMDILRKELESRGLALKVSNDIVESLLLCMKSKGIVEIPSEFFDDIPSKLIDSAAEKGMFFVGETKNNIPVAQKIPIETADIVNEDVE